MAKPALPWPRRYRLLWKIVVWIAKRNGAQAMLAVDQPDYHWALWVYKIRREN